MNGAVRPKYLSLPLDAPSSDRLGGEQLMQLLGRNWRMIVAIVTLFVGATAVYLSQQEPVYRAVSAMALTTSELRISQVDRQLESYELTSALIETELDRLRSRGFAEQVAERLDLFKDPNYVPVGKSNPALDTPERRRAVVDELLKSYQPQRSGESLVIYIEAHASTPIMASRIANGVVESFIRQSIEAQTETLEQSIQHLRYQVETVAEQLTRKQMEMAHLIRENVMDDENLAIRLRRERSHIVSVLNVMDVSGGDPAQREELQTRLDDLEAQLDVRTQKEMELNQLERSVDLLSQRYQTMVERLNQIESQLDQVEPDAHQVTKAEIPVRPSWPNMPTTLALAVPSGLMLGFIVALMKSSMDCRIWAEAQVIRISQLPNLGQLPSTRLSGGLINRRRRPAWFLRRFPQSQYSEALRALMVIFGRLSTNDRPPRVIMITSPLAGDGKSMVVTSMGAVAALEGMRVLLLDFDSGRNGAQQLLGLSSPSVSHIDMIEGRQTWARAATAVPEYEGFDVISFDHQTQLTLHTALAFCNGPLAQMKTAYDMVLLDAPPPPMASDAVRLGMMADATLVVVRAGKTSEHALQHCIEVLQNSGVRPTGTLINAIEPRRFRRMKMGRANA